MKSANFVSDFVGDLRYASRGLRRSPGFALLAIVIMALGIGANTAVFSVVNAVLFKPLPYPDADRIVTISTAVVTSGERNPLVTLANFRDWRDQSRSFEAMATYRGGEAPVSPGATAEYARHANVDPDFFRVFGVTPLVGRLWSPEELVPGNDSPSVLISHAFWQTRFAGDPRVLGQTLRLGINRWQIVGIMPPGFQFPNRTDIWSPQVGRGPGSRTSHSFLAVGRLKVGVSMQQAQADLATVAVALEQQYPQSNQGRGVALSRLQDQLVGDVRLTLYLLWGVVGVVLLIACANTATLLLGKATARAREVAVRAAVGASRGRIIRQLISESLLLALFAGASGTLLAFWVADALVALAPADAVRLAEPAIDRRVLGFTLVVSIVTSMLFGLVPALHASSVELVEAMRQAGTRSVMGAQALYARRALVISEIALAVVLLTGAGLLTKTLMALHQVDLGYQPQNALVMKATGVRAQEDTNRFFREAIAKISAIPGVVAVGASMVPPGDLSNSGNGAYFIDRVPEPRDRSKDPFAYFNVITPGLFAASGIPLKTGRDFNDADFSGQPKVAIVNEALVRKSFNGEDPIGRQIICSFDSPEPMTIVGVVGDVRQRSPGIEPLPDCYMPYTQHAYNSRTLHVIIRTLGEPTALAATVRRAAAEVSPEVPIAFTTMEETLSKNLEDSRFRALLFGVFAGLAACLALAGVYGVMAFAVGQRAKEIALRMALGAARASVLRLILGQGLLLAAIGLALGLAAAAAATRLLSTVLFGVQPIDAQVYAGVTLLLVLLIVVASYIPAQRATTLDPVEVLKTE